MRDGTSHGASQHWASTDVGCRGSSGGPGVGVSVCVCVCLTACTCVCMLSLMFNNIHLCYMTSSYNTGCVILTVIAVVI